MRDPKVWTAEKIKELRTEVLKLEQAEFGALFGVHYGTVSRWELGQLRPRISKQRQMSDIVAKEKVAA